jgi:protein-disulfide isomerase
MKLARFLGGLSLLLSISEAPLFGQSADKKPVAFKVAGKDTLMEEVLKSDQASFYELEKKKFDLIDRLAKEKYLEHFWQTKAKDTGKSVAEAQKEYETKNLKISDKEVKETLDKFKDHPSLQKLEKAEQERQVREYLGDRSKRELYDSIIETGLKKGELVILYPEPVEPVYNVTVTADDHVRFGPDIGDTKPISCKADDCPITIVEYSEFQCPYCVKVLGDVKKTLTEYKGKIRWIVRDFPLSFHDRARPAAIAAKCAAEQGKYWQMYTILFENQQNLGDADFKSHAGKIGLDKGKFETCLANPGPMEAKIDRNFQSGVQLGVSGTPAFFINGKKLSGAVPYSEFKRIIENDLAQKTKKS